MYGDAQGAAIEGHQRRFQDAISAVGRSQYALLLLEEEAARRTSILRLNQKLMLLPPTEDGTGLASELDKFLMELIDQQALFPEREL